MSCIYPRWAWQLKIPNENGKHELTFQMQDREPDFRIPCNKCAGCQSRKRREWGIRMYHESQYHDQSSFITITYEDKYLPSAIRRDDANYFIKALRTEIPGIRYFITGEYGDKTKRPHYHAIIFGADFRGGSYPINDQLYGHPILNAVWPFGTVSAAEFTVPTAMYTAGYVAKKMVDRDTFSIMSRKPPIGKAWFEDHKDQVAHLETIQVDGQSFPIPQKYMTWLEGHQKLEQIKENRKAKTRFATDQQLDSLGKNLNAQTKNRSAKI